MCICVCACVCVRARVCVCCGIRQRTCRGLGKMAYILLSVPVKGSRLGRGVYGRKRGPRTGQDRGGHGGTISGRWRPPGSPSRIRERSRIITRAGGDRAILRHPHNKSAYLAGRFLTRRSCPRISADLSRRVKYFRDAGYVPKKTRDMIKLSDM